MALIPLKKYAELHGRDPASMRQKALRGGFATAQKLGRDWVIDEDESFTDGRIKSGKYKGWRKPRDEAEA